MLKITQANQTLFWQLALFSRFLLSISISIFSFQRTSNAQIIPDDTLNAESSQVTSSGVRDILSGGAIRGSNLFHSFREFNIDTLKEAYFANPIGIENIITRVTGKNRSQILGTLGVLGKGNLFLINPNGITFGKDSRLNLQGSFFATTANSLFFDNDWFFSAKNPQAPPLLKINVPIGLQMGANSGTIINQSQVTSSIPLPPNFAQIPIPKNAGLQVLPGQNLGLIAGDIVIDGGGLTASSGQIFLGSTASPGLVSFNPTQEGLNFNYDNIPSFGNISISNNSLINTSGIGGGQVNIIGRNISLDNSRIYSLTLGNNNGKSIDIQGQNFSLKNGSQISSLTLGKGKGSDINILTTNSVEMIGLGSQGYRQSVRNYTRNGVLNPFDPNITLITASSSDGNAGNIFIDTDNLLLRDGVLSGSGTFGNGDTGNIKIHANNFEIIGSTISTVKIRESTGKAGSISIETEKLTLQDEATLSSISFAQGEGGNINIKAREDIKLLKTPPGAFFATSILTTTLGVDSNAGNINIDTKRLIVSDGAAINSSNGGAFGNNLVSSTNGVGGNIDIKATESLELFGISGVLINGGLIPSSIAAQTITKNRGGDINISTPNLSVRDGGIISAASLGLGNAGSIKIDANNIEVSGSNGKFISRIDVSVGSLSNLSSSNPIGNAGSLDLNTQQLLLQNGGLLTVQAVGNANAGDINLVTNTVNLDNQAKIDAATASGSGGNINLKTQDMFLRRNSQIRTDAGNANGGNIDIDSRFILAVSKENSDITANAIRGNGGKINITTKGIFGLQVNNKLTNRSDITASSQLGVDGVVTINTFKTEPKIIEQLPSNLVNTDGQIAQTCSNQARQNSFTITGKGGITPAPKEVLNTTPSWYDWRINSNQNSDPSPHSQINNSSLIEANRLVFDKQGKPFLVAKDTTFRSTDIYQTSICKK